jgi:asparagine synthase (glutamine-hydrolysing)
MHHWTAEVSIVFNGEVYNFEELRTDLMGKGHRFRSTGDTEVILGGYVEYGSDFFSRLRGMFAIALWDGRRGVLHLVRDHLGKKPLFWRQDAGGVAFSSEVATLVRADDEIDPVSVQEYFTYLYVPYPRTIWKDIRCLPPASRLSVSESGVLEHVYWSPAGHPEQGGDRLTYGDAKDRVSEGIDRAVARRMVSDRPVGIFLSGGLDSSVIAATAARVGSAGVSTFSVSLDTPGYRFNERDYARMVATHIGSDHHELTISSPPRDEVFPFLSKGFGQPFGNPTAVLTYLLSRRAREEIVVGLVGDGGDEAFLGYPRYRFADRARLVSRLLGRAGSRMAGALASHLPESTSGSHLLRRAKLFLGSLADPDFLFEWAAYFHYGLRDELLDQRPMEDSFAFFRVLDQSNAPADSEAARASRLDFRSFVPCNLMDCADRMAMQHGFELRAPFLDVDLVELVDSLPKDFKLKGGHSKRILREIGAALLPPKIVARKKRGFNPPVGLWFEDHLDHWLERYVSGATSGAFDGLLRREAVLRMAQLHRGQRMDLSTELWSVFAFLDWYEECRNVPPHP